MIFCRSSSGLLNFLTVAGNLLRMRMARIPPEVDVGTLDNEFQVHSRNGSGTAIALVGSVGVVCLPSPHRQFAVRTGELQAETWTEPSLWVVSNHGRKESQTNSNNNSLDSLDPMAHHFLTLEAG